MHPDVHEIIEKDLKILHTVAKTVEYIFPTLKWISLPEEVVYFGEMMRRQMDFTIEAEHLEKFNKNFKGSSQIIFPAPIKPLVTPNIMVETLFENSVPVRLFSKHGVSIFDQNLYDIGINGFLKMLVFDNFVHSDLHPGNILVTFAKPIEFSSIYEKFKSLFVKREEFIDQETINNLLSADTTKWNKMLSELKDRNFTPRWILIDAGLTTTLSSDNYFNFLDLFKAIANENGPLVAELLVSRSKSPSSVTNVVEFEEKIVNLISRIKSSRLSLSKFKFGDILTNVFDIVNQHCVLLEGAFVNTGISILLLEGIGRQLDPRADLIARSLPFLDFLDTDTFNSNYY